MKKTIAILSLICFFSTLTHAQPGTLDATFGTGGKVKQQVSSGYDYINDLVLQPDGKIIAAGTTQDTFCVTRYLSNGIPDSSFGNNGIVVTKVNLCESGATSVALQANGKIIVAGTSNNCLYFGTEFTVLRYNNDGTPDSTFGADGIVISDFGITTQLFDIELQHNGKIVAAGYARDFDNFYYGDEELALVRYNSDGSLDATFGLLGIVLLNLNTGELQDDALYSVKMSPDGKIVASGAAYNAVTGSSKALIIKFDKTGAPDSSFSNNGILTSDFSSSAYSMALQPDGKIVISGGTPQFSVLRVLPEGIPDSTFGDAGVATADFYSGNDWPLNISLQVNGKIIVAGKSDSIGYLHPMVAMARFNTDGSLDSSFGTNGKVLNEINNGAEVLSICLQHDGKILLGGDVKQGNDQNFLVLRYLNDDSVLTCSTPFNLTALNVTESKAHLKWTVTSTPQAWRIRYKPAFTGASWITKIIHNGNETNIPVLNLNPSTQYLWQIRSLCAGDSLSPWSASNYFTTLPLRLMDSADDLDFKVYPNPVSTEGTVQFSLSENTDVTIQLFDLQGRKIKTLAEGNFEAGSHQLSFEKDNLPSGICFIQLRTSGAIIIKQVALQ